MTDDHIEIIMGPPPPYPPRDQEGPSFPNDIRALLAGFAENLTARADSAPEVYEREGETAQILQALASPLKGRVVVLGPARAGKSAVVHSVVRRIAGGDCPPELKGREVWRLRPTGMPFLSERGRWSALLDHLFGLWARHPEIMLFFDEINRATRLPGADDHEYYGPTLDMAAVLATLLRRMPGICLAEAEENAYRRFLDSYSDYEHIFLPVRVPGFDRTQARAVVRRVAADLGAARGVTVTEGAVEQAIDLSQRFELDRAQPGKAIDVLHNALAVTPGGDGARLTAEDVIARFGEQSGLPRLLLDESVPFNEDDVHRYFRQRVLAQEQAVDATVQALSLLRARVHNPKRPMGVFFFLGPTGVGKTEMARTLAEYVSGSSDRLVRFNMADYGQADQGADIFGSPYARDVAARRGQLTNRLAGRLFSVIVLDEFEKASPAIYQRFLQLFDEGLLINGHEETVNLRNTIIVVTSNFGAHLVQHGQIGYNVRESLEAREQRVITETEAYFTPEFMNRIDAVCIFHPLNRSVMGDIARREIGDLLQRDGITRRQIDIEITDEVIEHVVNVGYSPHYGARYLKRQIEKAITYPLAREINALPVGATGGTIRLHARRGRVYSAYLPPAEPEPAAPAAPAPPLAEPPLSLEEIRSALPVLAARVEALEAAYRVSEARADRDSILNEMSDVTFWDDQVSARRKLDTYQRASSTVELLDGLRQALDGLVESSAAATAATEAVIRPYKFLLSELPRVEFTAWLSGPFDTCGAYVRINVKSKLAAGRQWAASLAKMYLGWAKQRGLATTVLGEDQTPEGGAVTITLVISGFGVYGLLRGESGTHRLVQSAKVRGKETTQRLAATVTVLPELNEDELPALPGDLSLTVKAANRSGLLIPRVTAQAIASDPATGRRLSLSGDLPPDDLAPEAARVFRTDLYVEAEEMDDPSAASTAGLVRSYIRSTKDKGVHDHRTGQRTVKIKRVLEGDIQAFLDEALKRRAKAAAAKK